VTKVGYVPLVITKTTTDGTAVLDPSSLSFDPQSSEIDRTIQDFKPEIPGFENKIKDSS
jgi:hypothetical protein